MLPEYIATACENARQLVTICNVLGLGDPPVSSIPALIEQVHHSHHHEPDFWDKDFEL